MDTASRTEFLYLTTTGRRTGLPREIEIWFVRQDARFYILSEHGRRAQWVKNILAEPRVRWRVDQNRFAGSARILDPTAEPELNTRIRSLSQQKYGWGDGLVVELTPEQFG